jgi:hypothetical protein
MEGGGGGYRIFQRRSMKKWREKTVRELPRRNEPASPKNEGGHKSLFNKTPHLSMGTSEECGCREKQVRADDRKGS